MGSAGGRASEQNQEQAATKQGSRTACRYVAAEKVTPSGPGGCIKTLGAHELPSEAWIVAQIWQAADVAGMLRVATSEIVKGRGCDRQATDF